MIPVSVCDLPKLGGVLLLIESKIRVESLLGVWVALEDDEVLKSSYKQFFCNWLVEDETECLSFDVFAVGYCYASLLSIC